MIICKNALDSQSFILISHETFIIHQSSRTSGRALPCPNVKRPRTLVTSGCWRKGGGGLTCANNNFSQGKAADILPICTDGKFASGRPWGLADGPANEQMATSASRRPRGCANAIRFAIAWHRPHGPCLAMLNLTRKHFEAVNLKTLELLLEGNFF